MATVYISMTPATGYGGDWLPTNNDPLYELWYPYYLEDTDGNLVNLAPLGLYHSMGFPDRDEYLEFNLKYQSEPPDDLDAVVNDVWNHWWIPSDVWRPIWVAVEIPDDFDLERVVYYETGSTANKNVVFGGSQSEQLVGTDGDDVLFGYGGVDLMAGGPGDDMLDGGPGVDAAFFSAAFIEYAWDFRRDGAWVCLGPEGFDELRNIEDLVFVDGRVTFDPNDHLAQIYRLYFATLGREPDALGLNFQSARLDAGTSLVAVTSGFVNSPEFQATYGPITDAQFVDLLYGNVLDRAPAANESAYHVGRLQSGASRSEVVVGFSESPEHVQKHIDAVNGGLWDIDEGLGSVARLYFGMLERLPETAGLWYYWEELDKGLTVQQVANGFAASPEFQAKYGSLTDSGYVSQLYANILERAPTADEVAYHAGRLSAGATRGDVAAGFTEAPEFQLKTLPLVDWGIGVADALL